MNQLNREVGGINSAKCLKYNISNIASNSLFFAAPDIQPPAAVVKPEPKEPPQMAQSIITASNQFSKALKSQAEASARAWSHLHSTFDGHFTDVQQTPGENGVGRSVWDIEQSLDNMENFLRVIDEVGAIIGTYSKLECFQ